MLERVLATIDRHQMVSSNTRLLVAVSGGPDSVCLLHVLRAAGVPLAGVAHFNHKLRGEASDGDERFVAALALQFGLPFYRESGGPTPGNLEQTLRCARQAFFRRLIGEGRGDRVALGHTLDDQAETVLFRILRGSGLAGLAGILPVTAEGLVRPLLHIRRSEVEEYLRAQGIPWREDASNRDPRFARNRIRHALLPQLTREWNPQMSQNLAQLADLAHEEERWWDSQLDMVSTEAARTEMEVARFANMPRALARRAVRRAIRQARGRLEGITFAHIEQVLELVARPGGDGRVALPGVLVERSFAWVRFVRRGERPAAPPQTIVAPGTYSAPDGMSLIQIELLEPPQESKACDTLGMECAAWDLELRGWRPGDRYRPAGRDREYKLRELFQQARVPSWKRALWPILTGKGKILWARGFGVAADFTSKKGMVMRITERSEDA